MLLSNRVMCGLAVAEYTFPELNTCHESPQPSAMMNSHEMFCQLVHSLHKQLHPPIIISIMIERKFILERAGIL